jgi:hypothetical protein
MPFRLFENPHRKNREVTRMKGRRRERLFMRVYLSFVIALLIYSRREEGGGRREFFLPPPAFRL